MNNKTINGIKCILYLFGLLVLTLPVQAASFDCAKANTTQEILICFDYRLSDLDSRLAWTYTEALKQVGNPEIIKQAQKDWLARREPCKDVKCIMHAYIDRIAVLSPETNLEDLYFPKENQPWEYLPEPGYEVGSGGSSLQGNNLSFLASRKVYRNEKAKYLVIPLGVNEDQIRDGNGNKPANMAGELSIVAQSTVNPKPVSESGRMVNLGGMRIAEVAVGYGECHGELGDEGIYVERKLPWAKDNMLVLIRPREWEAYYINAGFTSPDCDETNLKVMPTFMVATVLNDTLYLSEYRGGDFVLRLNRNLQTGSSLVGNKIFLAWGNDVNKLAGAMTICDRNLFETSSEHLACVDRQLQKIIKVVSPFYKLGE